MKTEKELRERLEDLNVFIKGHNNGDFFLASLKLNKFLREITFIKDILK